MLRIFANSLFTDSLYTRTIVLIFIMWDYFDGFMCEGDMVLYEAFGCTIKSRSLIVT